MTVSLVKASARRTSAYRQLRPRRNLKLTHYADADPAAACVLGAALGKTGF